MNNCLLLPQAQKLRDGIMKNIKAVTSVKQDKHNPNTLECGHTKIHFYLKEKIQHLKIIPIAELVIRSGCGCQSHTVRLTEAENPEFYQNLAQTIKDMETEYNEKLDKINKTQWAKFGLVAESLGSIEKNIGKKKIHYEYDARTKEFYARVRIPSKEITQIERIIRALENQ